MALSSDPAPTAGERRRLARWAGRLPAPLRRLVHRLQWSRGRWLRFCAGLFCLVASPFLPLLGTPVAASGLLLLAHDVAPLRRGLLRAVDFAKRKGWQRQRPPRGNDR